jgi:hypothetical protein
VWDVTAAIVRAWDSYSLLAGRAPADALDREIASLVAQIPRITSATVSWREISSKPTVRSAFSDGNRFPQLNAQYSMLFLALAQ